ncbi:hypothetical protein PHIN8_15830 [Polynucleobacter sp. HIN8]|uniref:hypothetical protein n=1 Tax=Polynucleobacter sp. HIN8 TaxID=3047867 RepID=UPI0025734524|nr:hypothetical protein [Polynucleobacter sp. HIN8]BEI39639.1 hypothetical protein PHIN8_15830 [Polynucleobacter sp. HIN8]
MQLIWIGGSTSQVKKISITGKGLIKLTVIICIFLFLTGFGVHFLGYRIAFHVNPELTRAMGGAISIQQKELIEASYKEQVQKLEANIAQVNQKIEELTVIKDQFADIATPAPVKSKSNNLNTK